MAGMASFIMFIGIAVYAFGIVWMILTLVYLSGIRKATEGIKFNLSTIAKTLRSEKSPKEKESGGEVK